MSEKWKVSVTFPDVILLEQKRFAQVAVVNSARDGWQARAALVATAPDLLAAMKTIEEKISAALGDAQFTNAEYDDICALIAKAEGRA